MTLHRLSDLARAALASLLLLGPSACDNGDTPSAATAAIQPAASGDAATEAPAAPADGGFDIASVPLSEQSLGAFPYLSLPDGYRIGVDPMTRDFDRFPFWVEDHFEWIEGRTFTAGIRSVGIVRPGHQDRDPSA